MLRETPGIPAQPPSPTPFSGTIAALEPQDEPICRRCTASSSNRSPSVGLAVVDSMTGCRIKAFASHAKAFRDQAASSASARITPRRAVLADRFHHLPMHALFAFHMHHDQRM